MYSNSVLYNAMIARHVKQYGNQRGFSYNAFAKECGISSYLLCHLVYCRMSPKTKKDTYRSVCKKIARKLRIGCQKLFPEECYNHIKPPQGRNTILEEAIKDFAGSSSACSKQIGVSQTAISALISKARSPFRKDGGFRQVCEKIAHPLGYSCDELFKIEDYEPQSEKTPETLALNQLDHDSIHGLQTSIDNVREAELSILSTVIERDMKKLLSFREREVLKLYYGIIGGYSYRVSEIAKIFKTSEQNTYNIIRGALVKLRNSMEFIRLLNQVG